MDATIEVFAFRLGAAPSTRQQELAYRRILRADPCSYCGAPAPSRDADHIRSRRVSREDGWQNLTAACQRCNKTKGSSSMLSLLVGEAIGPDHRELERQRLEAWRARRAA